MQINHWEARRGWAWITAGWRLFTNDAPLWLTMAFMYVLAALLFDQIPFMGYLLWVLVTPLLAAGAFSVSQTLATTGAAAAPMRGRDLKERARVLATRALKALFQVFHDPGKTLAVMVVSTLALGAVVVIQILQQLLKVGGSGLPAAGGVSVRVWLPALLGLLLVWVLKTVLFLIGLYAVYRVMLHEETPLSAIHHALQACVKNPAAVAMLAAVLMLPLMLAAYLSALAFLVLGLIALPLAVTSVYASAKDIYG